MPGTDTPNFAEMSPEQFAAWQQEQRPDVSPVAGEQVPTSINLSNRPSLLPPQVEQRMANAIFPAEGYANTASAWAEGEGYDWTTPMGHLIRLRPLPIEELAAKGLLDKLSRLPGVTDGLIRQSEGQPPVRPLTDASAIVAVLEVLNEVIPMIVVQPKIWPVPNPEDPDEAERERKPERVYPESVPFSERMAILNESTGGLLKWDGFRKES